MNATYTEKEKRAALDAYLVVRCQGGDEQALQQLMRHWYGRLYGFALGQLRDSEAAKDATQDSVVSISRGIRTLDDPASFPKWAYQIVLRRCADWQRREIRWRSRHVTDSADVIDAAPSTAVDAGGDSGAGSHTHALRRAISRLEPELRAVVRLYYFDDFSLKEIAELLDVPTGTIKSRLYYARKKLKQTMGEHHDD